METEFNLSIVNSINKDILKILDLVNSIANDIYRRKSLETEIILLENLVDCIYERSDFSFEDTDNLKMILSTTNKLKIQSEILQSKVDFIYFDPEPLNDLFFELKIYLKSLLLHLNQLDVE